MHAVHAASRIMAARRRARNTSPAKMAIFEMRNRRAVHARTPHASIPATSVRTTGSPSPRRVSLREERNLEIFSARSPRAPSLKREREREKKRVLKTDCLLTSVSSSRGPPARTDTCVDSRGETWTAVRSRNIRDLFLPETAARDETRLAVTSAFLDRASSRPLRYEDSDYRGRGQWQ